MNCINNISLIEWISKIKEFKIEDLFIEITGGEPALYKDLDELLVFLTAIGYKGIVKTNGSLPIIKTDNFKIVSAWHKDQSFPKYFDIICIIKNPNDNYLNKKLDCINSGIPYRLVEFNSEPHGENRDKKADGKISIFNKVTHINSSGQITMCSRIRPNENITIWNNSKLVDGETVRVPCSSCKNVYDVEVFVK